MLALPISVNPIDTIHHADCFVLMDWLYRAGIQVDLIASDMPYGTTACAWDKRVDLDRWWVSVKRVLKPRGVFLTTASEPFASLLRVSNLDWYKYDWVWRKNNATGFNHCANMPLKNYENICVFSPGVIGHAHLLDDRMNYSPQNLEEYGHINKRAGKGFLGTMERESQSNVYITEFTNYPRMILDFDGAAKTFHPTQKPIALYEYLIRTYTQPGDVVLDPFCGSGTTGLAALRTGRRYILGDSDLGYVEAARKRIQNADPFQPSQVMNDTMQLSLFAKVV